jgi:hypothetical protein
MGAKSWNQFEPDVEQLAPRQKLYGLRLAHKARPCAHCPTAHHVHSPISGPTGLLTALSRKPIMFKALLLSGLCLFATACSAADVDPAAETEDGLTAAKPLTCTSTGRAQVPPTVVRNVSGEYTVAEEHCIIAGQDLARGSRVSLAQKAETCQTVAVAAAKVVTRFVCEPRSGCSPYDMCAIALFDCETYGGDDFPNAPNPIEACKAAARGPGGVCSRPAGPTPVPVTTTETISTSMTLRAVSTTATGVRINAPQSGKDSRCTLLRK